MKARLILVSLLLAASSAFGTVTLQFSSVAGSLQNFATSAGAGGTAMTWGILIDTGGNGFSYNLPSTNYAAAGLTYTGGSLQALSLYGDGGVTDDMLFLAPNLMNVQPSFIDGMPVGTNRVTTVANIPITPTTVSPGDAFVVVWFDKNTVPTGTAIANDTSFGVVVHAGFVIPADGSTVSFASLFTGADPLRTQDFVFGVPEPSGILLGLLGAVGLLRRRR